MAKTPAEKSSKKATPRKPKRKKNNDSKEVAGLNLDGSTTFPVEPVAATCCSVCDAIPTGSWGFPWRDAAGNWQCLIGPSGAGVDKVLATDGSGPYWRNP